MKDNRKKEWIRALKFTLFSVSAGIIEISSFTLLNGLTTWNYWVCYLTALLLSVLWNFTLNRRFTFQSAANIPAAMAKTLLYYALFTPLSTWAGDAMVKTGWNEYLVTALNMAANFITEYCYQRFYVYRNNIDDRKQK